MSLPDDAPVPLGTWPSVTALEGRFLARRLVRRIGGGDA